MKVNSLRWFAVLATVMALVATTACKKKDGAADAAAKGPLKAEVGVVAMPVDILGFAGAKSMDDLTGVITSIATKFAPELGAMIGAQIPAMLQGKVLGVKNLSWLDTQKPVKIVVLDYKKFNKPMVILLPFKTKDLLTAALPDNKTPGTPDNETKFASPNGTPLFLNVIGDYAVFTLEDKAFATAKAFLEGDFARYAFAEPLDIQMSSVNLQQVAAVELAGIKDTLAQNLAATPATAAMPGMSDLIKKEVDLMLDVLKQTQILRLALQWDNADLTLLASLKVIEGQGLAKFAAETLNRKMELYKTFPGDAWLVFASNVDPKIFAGWSELGFDFWSKSLVLTPEETAKLKELSTQAMDVQTGDNALYFGREGEFPLRVLTATAVKDGAKAKALTYALYGMLMSKAGVVIEKNAGPELKALPKLDWTSMTTLIAGLAPVLATTGVSMNIKDATAGDLTADVLEVGVDYSKVPGASSGEMERVAKMIGNKVTGAIAFDKSRMYFGFGRDAVADLGKLSKGTVAGASPLTAVIDKSGFTPAIAAWLSVVDLLKVIAYFDEAFAVNLPGLATAKTDAGVSLVIGGHAGNVVDARLSVPVARMADLLPKPGQPPAGGAPIAPAPRP
jgi:hypothetical protein